MRRALLSLALLFPLSGAAQPAIPGLPGAPGGDSEVLTLKVVTNTAPLVAGSPFKLAVAVEIGTKWHINSHTPKEDYLIPSEVGLPTVAGIAFEPVIYPAHHERKFAFSETPMAVYEGRTPFLVNGKVDASAAPGEVTLPITFDFQACTDQQCMAPTQKTASLTVTVAAAGTPTVPQNAEFFSGMGTTGAAPVDAPLEGQRGEKDPFEGKSMLLILGIVFVSGLALNLTPCVYPLIPITVGFFSRQSQGSTARTFTLASLYVIGMSVTYSALGVFAALSGSLFGVWLQKPIVLVGIAGIVLALAASMFGAFEIQAPEFIRNRAESRKGGLGAFIMGLFVGFVAAPCIGPFVLSLLTYVAQKADPVLGFVLFFTLAMGLGLPYLVLGTASGSLKQLPRSGEWMVVVKKVFGFILVSLAVYFLRPLIPERIYDIALAVPLIVGGVYLLFFEKNGSGIGWFKGVKIALALALLGVGIAFALPERQKPHLAFTPYSDAAVAAAKAAGKPVMIDFYADWCMPCKELDKETFTDPRVIEATGNWVLLKANLTKEGAPEVKELRAKWQVKGVPTILFLGPDGLEKGERLVGFEPPEKFVLRLK